MLARSFFAAAAAVALCSACGGSNGSTPPASSTPGTVQLRFLEAAPTLEAIVNGQPTDIGPAYLSVGGTTIASSFPYAALTAFSNFPAGAQSIELLDSIGYKVGPLETSALAGGKRYTIAVIGTYPNYKAIALQEPDPQSNVSLTAYGAAPSTPRIDFGSFHASGKPQYKQLGSVSFGTVVRKALGAHVTDFGGYIGHGQTPIRCGTVACGALTVHDVNSFDSSNVLPFNAANRFSLFFIDPKPGQPLGPVVGSLDQ
jgi:hypothetical protein